jgi:hypothetical protein
MEVYDAHFVNVMCDHISCTDLVLYGFPTFCICIRMSMVLYVYCDVAKPIHAVTAATTTTTDPQYHMDIEHKIFELAKIQHILKDLDGAIEALNMLENEEHMARYNHILGLLRKHMEQTMHPNTRDYVHVLEILSAENADQPVIDLAIHWLYIARVLWRENPDARMLPFNPEDFNRIEN